MTEIDLLVVGGGINGTGIARDAAGRGLSVMLVEKDDLAAHTSSASSKLIHGGLRYLEQWDFKLVRESLAERERLLRAAPHIVRPLEFVLPLARSSRPAWMIRAGLFLYDHLGARELLPASRAIRLDGDLRGNGLQPGDPRAFTYWDCRAQDSRLVVLNAIDAAERGATVLTRTELVEARREGRRWRARMRSEGTERTVTAGALVNVAGPWAGDLFDRIDGAKARQPIRLVKGSHIVVPRLYAGEHAFILQNADGRVVFAIPFEDEFTLVGTTDVDLSRPPTEARIGEDEIEYLLDSVACYFTEARSSDDIVWTYAGVRTLVGRDASSPAKASRDYVLETDAAEGKPPMLSVFGGKLTTYRHLAEQAVDRLARFFPKAKGRWTRDAVLPGGNIPGLDLEGWAQGLRDRYPSLPVDLVDRLASTYGTRATDLLESARSIADLGEHFGAGLYAREVDYLVQHEWARTAEDILFRRTKLGLHVSSDTAERLAAYLGH